MATRVLDWQKIPWNSSHCFVIDVHDPSSVEDFQYFTGFEHSPLDCKIIASISSATYFKKTIIDVCIMNSTSDYGNKIPNKI